MKRYFSHICEGVVVCGGIFLTKGESYKVRKFRGCCGLSSSKRGRLLEHRVYAHNLVIRVDQVILMMKIKSLSFANVSNSYLLRIVHD